MGNIKLKKPDYELSHLKAAMIQSETNIVAFQRGITKEEKKKVELQGYIDQWEVYNKQGK